MQDLTPSPSSGHGDSELLHVVLRIKETFYRSGFSHYDRCIAGGLRLIPDEPQLEALCQDYQAMLATQMFYGDTAPFETVAERLLRLEAEINWAGRSRREKENGFRSCIRLDLTPPSGLIGVIARPDPVPDPVQDLTPSLTPSRVA